MSEVIGLPQPNGAPPLPFHQEQRDNEIFRRTLAGESVPVIARALGVNIKTVYKSLRRPVNRRRLQAIREATKHELIVNSRQLLRKYATAMTDTPTETKEDAQTHLSLSKALANLYNTATHASGEATERIEQKTVTLTLEAKREQLATLLESYGLEAKREAFSRERAKATEDG